MVLPWLLFLPGVDASQKGALDKINLGLIVFIVSCMSIATVGNYLGLNEWITVQIVPAFLQMSTIQILLVTLLCGIVSNIVMTPGAMLPTLCAPFAGIALEVGINPLALIMTLIITCDVYIFPHEIACFMILVGFGLISISEFVKLAAIKTAMFMVFYALIQIPYWYLIGYIY